LAADRHNGQVEGCIRWLLARLRQAYPRGAVPSGWALAFDAVVAVAAAIGAVYEMTQRDLSQVVILPLGSSAVPRALLPLVGKGQVVLAGPAHASAWLLAGAALTALPLAWRRLYPVLAWLAVIAAIVAVHRAYVPPVALGTAVYTAYSAFVHSRYRNLAIAMVSVTTVFAAIWIGDALPRLPGKVTAVVAILAATVAGLGIRSLRQRLASSTAQLRRAADEARAATERALAAERSRIAAELHDVVTHNVSVMIVQAGAARKIMALSPADAQDALLAVESTGREAMTELRNLLGLLCPAADGSDEGAHPSAPGPGVVGKPTAANARLAPGRGHAALRPQPGLGELDALIGRVAAAGLPVSLLVVGVPQPLPPGADLAAYRVAQEGLTNVLRHAGQATATVRVTWSEALEITVTDDGPAGSSGTANRVGSVGSGPGRGLLGLRERLALYGGELIAGPRPDGGWCLRAVLPLPEPTAAAVPAAGSPVPGMISARSAG
jgi:signal transduction histidine kinase